MDRTNVERLADVLKDLHARLRGVDEEVPFLLDAQTLLARTSFTTDAGDLDLLAIPAGTTGYEELAASAWSVDLGEFSILVATIDDLIRIKRAAGRPKDLAQVEILVALRDELGAGADDG